MFSSLEYCFLHSHHILCVYIICSPYTRFIYYAFTLLVFVVVVLRAIFSFTILIVFSEQLTLVDLNPKGVVTIRENRAFIFNCKAESIPKSTIEWYIEGIKLTDNVETTNPKQNTIISEISYLAKKEHNSRNLYCSANDTFKLLNSSFVKLDINCK